MNPLAHWTAHDIAQYLQKITCPVTRWSPWAIPHLAACRVPHPSLWEKTPGWGVGPDSSKPNAAFTACEEHANLKEKSHDTFGHYNRSWVSKDDWTGTIMTSLDAAQSIEVEAIDVPSDSIPEQIFMPPHLRLIRIYFPSFADGRGLTLVRMLRLLGFTGRLRAKGHVIADQYAMARRSGFDEIEISPDLAKRQPEEHWLFRAKDWQEHDYQARLRAH